MPKTTETDLKNGKITEEFTGRVFGISPREMARFLGSRYKREENTHTEDTFDSAVAEYADFLRDVLRNRPGNRQATGFLAYAEWVLGKRPAGEAIPPILDALREYRSSVLDEALRNIEKVLRYNQELDRFYPVGSPPVLLLTYTPGRKFAVVAAPDVPDETLTPRRGMVRRAYGFDKLDPHF